MTDHGAALLPRSVSGIPARALTFEFVRSSGPGGQNVNKVATAVQLRVALDAAGFAALLEKMLQRLDASSGMIEMRFPYFISKRAPVSGVSSLLDYKVMLRGERKAGGSVFTTQVSAPATSLCPCSKEISEYGAHNQRSIVTVQVEPLQPMEWHELVRFAEDSASSEIWPMLKRADEKWITERAYENPKFVEDLVRDVALRLDADARVGRYAVDVENFESIHNHSAFARIERS
jgi:GTP cyclohydrolase I